MLSAKNAGTSAMRSSSRTANTEIALQQRQQRSQTGTAKYRYASGSQMRRNTAPPKRSALPRRHQRATAPGARSAVRRDTRPATPSASDGRDGEPGRRTRRRHRGEHAAVAPEQPQARCARRRSRACRCGDRCPAQRSMQRERCVGHSAAKVEQHERRRRRDARAIARATAAVVPACRTRCCSTGCALPRFSARCRTFPSGRTASGRLTPSSSAAREMLPSVMASACWIAWRSARVRTSLRLNSGAPSLALASPDPRP